MVPQPPNIIRDVARIGLEHSTEFGWLRGGVKCAVIHGQVEKTVDIFDCVTIPLKPPTAADCILSHVERRASPFQHANISPQFLAQNVLPSVDEVLGVPK